MQRITYMGNQIWPKPKKQPRTKGGEYTSLKSRIKALIRWVAIRTAVLASVSGAVFGAYTLGSFDSARTVFAQNATSTTAAMEGMSIEQLEARLYAIVWGGESQKQVLAAGEIKQTFDPNSTEMASCVKTGGNQPEYCISWGPRQIKMTMAKTYWPKMHDGKPMSDMEALVMANSNEESRRFFLDCAVEIGTKDNPYKCAKEWTTFVRHAAEGKIYIDLIREAKGITL